MEMKIEATQTYATRENVTKAVAKASLEDLRYFVMIAADGRFFPVFVGEVAIQRGVHFKFNVVG